MAVHGNFFYSFQVPTGNRNTCKITNEGCMVRPEGNTMGVKGQMNGVNWTMPVSIMVFVYRDIYIYIYIGLQTQCQRSLGRLTPHQTH